MREAAKQTDKEAGKWWTRAERWRGKRRSAYAGPLRDKSADTAPAPARQGKSVPLPAFARVTKLSSLVLVGAAYGPCVHGHGA